MIDGRVAAVHSRGARVDVTSSYGAARAAIARCRAADFIGLVKPRVISLAIFTALVGLVCNPGDIDLLQEVIAVLAIAAGASAAGALNMWYDADIDAVMNRTAMRPIPLGQISKIEALVFGLVLAFSAVTLDFKGR